MGPNARESWLAVRLSPITKKVPGGTVHSRVCSASRGWVGTGPPSTSRRT
jgi:hypothetical protein